MTPSILTGRRGLLASVVSASLGQGAAAVLSALAVQSLVDGVFTQVGEPDQGSAIVWAGVLLGCALAAAGLEFYRTNAAERLGLTYVGEVRERLFASLMNASADALGARRQGTLLLPFVGDLSALKQWVSDGLVRLIAAGAMTVLLLAMLASHSVALALAAGLILALAAALMAMLSGPLNHAVREARARRGAIANFVAASIRATQTVQVFARFGREARRLRRRNASLTRASMRLARVTAATNVVVLMTNALLVGATLLVGFFEMQRGALSFGVVVAALSITGLLAGAVRDLGVAFALSRSAAIAFEKIERMLALFARPEGVNLRGFVRPGQFDLSFDKVAASPSFAPMSASAKLGDLIVVTGPSGSGKSTLLALAAGLREPSRGRVRINGRDLRRIKPTALRRRIGYASAAAPLMRGSIESNLRYGDRGASEAEIARIARICGLTSLFDRLPGGAQFRVSEGAPELSVGERQRVLIARAMIGSPPLLILDDVDSHLDADQAAQIAEALRAYPGVVLVASSSLPVIAEANAIWRIEEGRITIERRAGKAQPALCQDVTAS